MEWEGKGPLSWITSSTSDINCILASNAIQRTFTSLQKMEETPDSKLRFICMDAADITEVFAKKMRVSRIFELFQIRSPDRHKNRRLTSIVLRYDAAF